MAPVCLQLDFQSVPWLSAGLAFLFSRIGLLGAFVEGLLSDDVCKPHTSLML